VTSVDNCYRLRNEIPVAQLMPQLDWPHSTAKAVSASLSSLRRVPHPVNPKTNLARCFACETNFNPIDSGDGDPTLRLRRRRPLPRNRAYPYPPPPATTG